MKTALVTGGSRGIGSAIALGLGKNFHVVVGYANSEDKANDVVPVSYTHLTLPTKA